MSALKTGATITALLLVSGGSVIIYYTAYRGNNVAMLGYLMIILGWIILLFTIGGKWLMRDEIKFKDDRAGRTKQKSLNGAIYVLFCIAIGGNWMVIEDLSNKRVNNFLNNGPVLPSIATVTGLDETKGRSTTFYTAYITYQTTSGPIYQKIDNNDHVHFTGEELNINYSVRHPNMFYIVPKVVDTATTDTLISHF